MTDDGIVWEDPVEMNPRPTSIPWKERLGPLMEHPGQWARIHEVSRSSAWQVAGHLRKGIKPTPAGRWEFAARVNPRDTRRGYVYARYLGPEDDA